MMTYITAFIFYTLAMIGILLVGFIVYKKTFVMNKSENKGMIKILDSCPIGPKKTLMVVKIKNEKFLIASGAEHTTFLSKLSDDNSSKNVVKSELEKNQTILKSYSEKDIQIQEPKRFDDNKKSHLEKLQKQFMELYEKDEQPTPQNVINKAQDKHQIMKKLLEELNTVNSGSKTGRF